METTPLIEVFEAKDDWVCIDEAAVPEVLVDAFDNSLSEDFLVWTFWLVVLSEELVAKLVEFFFVEDLALFEDDAFLEATTYDFEVTGRLITF